MSAAEWGQGLVLTWSGKWHRPFPEDVRSQSRTLCGAYGYREDTYPKYVVELTRIATGEKQAPMCKKCLRAAVSE